MEPHGVGDRVGEAEKVEGTDLNVAQRRALGKLSSRSAEGGSQMGGGEPKREHRKVEAEGVGWESPPCPHLRPRPGPPWAVRRESHRQGLGHLTPSTAPYCIAPLRPGLPRGFFSAVRKWARCPVGFLTGSNFLGAHHVPHRSSWAGFVFSSQTRGRDMSLRATDAESDD